MAASGDTIGVGEAERILGEAARTYIAGCRARIGPFVDRHYRFAGALRIHRSALGWDVVRAPVNLSLAIPHVLSKIAEGLARALSAHRTADWLARRELMLKTDVEREVEWLIYTELLVMPIRQPGRASRRDALTEAILAHPEVGRAAGADPGAALPDWQSPEFAARLDEKMRSYTGTRNSAADMTAAMTSASAGIFMFSKLTPSALSLGPALAVVVAHRLAVERFPLGSWLGGIWYGMFPATPSEDVIWGVTGGLMVVIAVVAAFAGIVADPLQRLAGLHRRRLARFIDALEADLTGSARGRFTVRGHYVARVVDLVEIVRVTARAAL